MLATGQIRDLWMPALCLTLLSVSIVYALVDLFTGATFWSPLIISIFWAAYNMIPPSWCAGTAGSARAPRSSGSAGAPSIQIKPEA